MFRKAFGMFRWMFRPFWRSLEVFSSLPVLRRDPLISVCSRTRGIGHDHNAWYDVGAPFKSYDPDLQTWIDKQGITNTSGTP